MPADRAAAFLEALRETQLLEPGQLDALASDPAASGDDPKPLARKVVQRGWLTLFQVNQVLQGRGRTLVLGPYRLLDRLGEGAMGQVFKAHHQPMNRTVALKLIRKEKLDSPDAVRRFYQEIQAAAQLIHPNIVIAHDAGQAAGTHYFAMEYVEGTDLAKLVKQSGPLPVSLACECIRQAALGLQHAHERGLVHRDIKPHNLLVTGLPRPGHEKDPPLRSAPAVKILDLGLARLRGPSEQANALTQEGQVLGTPDYLAPEQALDSRAADIRADLYSLGCTLYFVLAGQPPYQGNSLTEVLLKHQIEQAKPLRELRPDVPEGLEAIVNKLISKRPEDRYQTPAEVVETLDPYCRRSGSAAIVATTPVDGTGAERRAEEDTLTEAPVPARNEVGAGCGSQTQRLGASAIRRLSQGARADRKRVAVLAGAGLLGVVVVLAVLFTRTGVVKETPGLPAPAPAAERARPEEVKAAAVAVPAPPAAVGIPPVAVPAPPAAVAVPPPVVGLGRSRVVRSDMNAAMNVVFLPDGASALGQIASRVVVWDLKTGDERFTLPAMPSSFGQLAVSPDGRYAAGGTQDRTVCVWDLQGKQLIHTLEGHTGAVIAVAFSPDGSRLLSGSQDETVRLWDIKTSRELRCYEGHEMAVNSVAFSPDGRQFVSSAYDQSVRLWDVATAAEVRRLSVSGFMTARHVVFSPTGRHVAAALLDQTVAVWEMPGGNPVQRLYGSRHDIAGIAFTPDGSRLLTCGGKHEGNGKVNDCTVRLWDVATGKQLSLFEGHTQPVSAVSVSPDGRYALSCSWDRSLRLWDLTEKAPPVPAEALARVPPPPARPVELLPFTPKVIAIPYTVTPSTRDGVQSVKFVERGRYVPVTGVAFLPDGKRALSATGRSLVLWDVTDGCKVLHRFLGHKGDLKCLALSADGRRAVTGADDHTVRVWEVEVRKALRTLQGHKRDVQTVALSADGRRALSVGPATPAILWDVETGQEVRRLAEPAVDAAGQHRSIEVVTLSADGRRAVTGGVGPYVIVWDLDAGQQQRQLGPHPNGVTHLALSSDGRRLVTSSSRPGHHGGAGLAYDRIVHVWDLEAGRELCRLEHSSGVVTASNLSADGRRAVSANRSNRGGAEISLSIWDVDKAQELGRLEGPDLSIGTIAFSPDGGRLLTGGLNATMSLWTVPPAKP